MATTVLKAFEDFRRQAVDLDPDETTTARASRDHLMTQLDALAAGDETFPRLTGSYTPYGSFARKTKIRPLDDIDLMMILDGSGGFEYASVQRMNSFQVVVQTPLSPLAPYADNAGYVSSIRILNRIKDRLGAHHTYRRSELKRNMQAVVLDLVSYDWVFDVVPAFWVGDTFRRVTHFLIPDGYGEWMRTDPRVDAETVTRTNAQHQYHLLPVVRLLKYWNRRTHKPRLSSFYFEVLTLTVFGASPVSGRTPEAIKRFFDLCPAYLSSPFPSVTGHGSNLDAGIDRATKQSVLQAMSEASIKAGYALMYEGQGDQERAIYWWQQVFGPDFPEYA